MPGRIGALVSEQSMTAGRNRIRFTGPGPVTGSARLRAAGSRFRGDVVISPGGPQTLTGNLAEPFQPAGG